MRSTPMVDPSSLSPPVSPAEWRRAGDHHDWRGHRIFHRVGGAGEPLLLIHGFPTSSWDWARLWAPLTARFRVLALDLIGFGFSAKPRRFAYSIVTQADLVEAFLAREGVARYRLVAHDYGVSVAQELLARHRDGRAVATPVAVCLLNGGLFPESHRPLVTQRLLASPIGPLVARVSSYRTFAAAFRRIAGDRPPDEAELRALWSILDEGDGKAVLPALMGYIAERRRHRTRWVTALIEARVPVRLIDGLADPVSGAHLVARYRELVPSPDVVELPGVGHYPQLEAPAAVLAAIVAGLARAEGAGVTG